MHLFWKKGYAATSIQNLVDEIGINRGSLYATYGQKQDLYLAAMDRYREDMVRRRFLALERRGSAKEAIREIFLSMVEAAAGKDGAMGCLVTNSAVELSPHDAEVSAKVRNSLTFMENAFTKAVERAQADGEIDRTKNARALAHFLTASIQGLRVVSKVNDDRARLKAVAEIALSALE